MSHASPRHLLAGLHITSLGTLASRVLGMARDMATAALLGMSGSGVMDAFVVAFRIPNLFRRLFGEGSLAASYLPVLAARLDRDRPGAWQLASVTLTWLAVTLAGLVLLLEALCGALYLAFGGDEQWGLLLGLAAVMTPYLFFICLAAQISATLHALSHFGGPALVPTVLNVCWLGAAWVATLWLAPDKVARAYVLAVSIVLAGVLQAAFQWPILRSAGFRFDYNWPAARVDLKKIVRPMAPMLLGLAVTQLNTFCDSLMAWALSAEPGGPQTIDWLPGAPSYPLAQGAASALYYGERLYQFPLGILGVAVATVIFPALSRHAARGHRELLGQDLTLGIRLVMFLGVPAGAGLILLSEPLARLLFERGEFTAADTDRVAAMIGAYGAGVWAFCALQVIVRGYFALGDQSTPLRVGVLTMALNVALNLALVWPLAETGLAISTSIAAAVQVGLLLWLFSRRRSRIDGAAIFGAVWRTCLATAVMYTAGAAAMQALPRAEGMSNTLLRVAAPMAAGIAAFVAASLAVRSDEWRLVLARPHGEDDAGAPAARHEIDL